jgi:hypothetical protein
MARCTAPAALRSLVVIVYEREVFVLRLLEVRNEPSRALHQTHGRAGWLRAHPIQALNAPPPWQALPWQK